VNRQRRVDGGLGARRNGGPGKGGKGVVRGEGGGGGCGVRLGVRRLGKHGGAGWSEGEGGASFQRLGSGWFPGRGAKGPVRYRRYHKGG